MPILIISIQWLGVMFQALQFILSFSIIVFLHELGHFLVARKFKCRVEKFYLFFNPWFSLFKIKKGDTEYGLGWIPFGGYVKISGMIDESMDKQQMLEAPKEYEYRAKPAWQRLLIIIAGVVTNLILAVVIFISIRYAWGESFIRLPNAKYGFVVDSIGKSMGLENGDKIIKIGAESNIPVSQIMSSLVLNNDTNIVVNRNGNIINIPISSNNIETIIKKKDQQFVRLRYPVIVFDVAKGSPAYLAHIIKGDKILAINDTPVVYNDRLVAILKEREGQLIIVTLSRNNDIIKIPVQLNKDGKLGIYEESDLKKLGFIVEEKKYTIISAIPAGYKLAAHTLGNYIKGIKQIFKGKTKASDSIGGIISIGNVYSTFWDWQSFWTLTGIFSLILAFMNILPIPALDGGHALFCLIEMVTRKKPHQKVVEYAQIIGMVILFSLMIYAIGLDFWRLFK